MKKKFLAAILVILIMSALAVPCLAAVSAGSIRYAPLRFDSITSGADSIRSDWNLNIFGSGTGFYAVDTSAASYNSSIVDYSANVSTINCDVYAPGAYFTLHCTEQIVNTRYLSSYKVCFGMMGEYSGTIDYSFQYVYMDETTDGLWREMYTTCSGTWSVQGGFSLGDSLVKEIARFTSSQFVKIRNLTLDFKLQLDGGETSTPPITFEFYAYPVDYNLYENSWMNQFNVVTTEEVVYSADLEDADLVGWLGDTASGILSAPLFGDFSLGGLLAAVLSIGLVVALIRIFGS